MHGGVSPEHRSRALSYEEACMGACPRSTAPASGGGGAREAGGRCHGVCLSKAPASSHLTAQRVAWRKRPQASA